MLRKYAAKNARMLSRPRILLLCSVVAFSGCHTAEKVAVSSFRVIDAPARYVRDRIDPEQSTTTTTTQTSDVVNPGHPVTAATPNPAPTQTTSHTTQTRTTSATPAPSRPPTQTQTRPTTTSTHSPATTAQT